MLRELRKRDLPGYSGLLTREFPEEGALLGIDPAGQARILRSAFRPDVRLLLGLLRWFGKPIVQFFLVEAEGKVAATAVLTFNRNAGYIGAVTVDPAFRRRGFGRMVIGGCAQAATRAGKQFVVLDVLRHNAPAQALYRSSGYRPLRSGAFLKKEVRPGSGGVPLPKGVRSLRRSDRVPLAAIASAAQPAEVTTVLPVEPSTFTLAPVIVRLLESETEAWVIDDGNGPVAFLRATVSRALEAANITAPILSTDVPPDRFRELLRYAESWIAERNAPRVVVEQWDDASRSKELLESEGYAAAIALDMLCLPLHA